MNTKKQQILNGIILHHFWIKKALNEAEKLLTKRRHNTRKIFVLITKAYQLKEYHEKIEQKINLNLNFDTLFFLKKIDDVTHSYYAKFKSEFSDFLKNKNYKKLQTLILHGKIIIELIKEHLNFEEKNLNPA